MLTVDLSNIWAHASLPELLELEGELGRAHQTLLGMGEDAVRPCWVEDTLDEGGQEEEAVLAAAGKIREQSQVCLVLAARGLCLGPQGVIAALGREEGSPELLFAGDSFGTHSHHALEKALEGRDYSLILVSGQGREPEFAAAARIFRWQLERKYGTEEAARRVYAITTPDSPLCLTAREEGWEIFSFSEEEPFSCLSPRWLLPLAVAGVNLSAFRLGAAQVRQEALVQSFENPLWLSVGVRNLMGRRGRGREILTFQEPCLEPFARWWQHLFSCDRVYPATALLPRDRVDVENALLTVLGFEAPEKPVFVDADWKNRDGLGHLEGKPLDWLEGRVREAAASGADWGNPLLTMDCGPFNSQTLGELSAFFLLSARLSALVQQLPAGEAPTLRALDTLLGLAPETGYNGNAEQIVCG